MGVSLTGIMDHPVLSGTLTKESLFKAGYDYESYSADGLCSEGRFSPEGIKHTYLCATVSEFYNLSGEDAEDVLDTVEHWPEFLPDILIQLKEVAIETNKEWAEALGINQSTAITCVNY